VLILKYLNLKNYLANFDENCSIYSAEVLVNKINRIINSDKFGHSYDGRFVYWRHFFGDTGYILLMLRDDSQHCYICDIITSDGVIIRFTAESSYVQCSLSAL